MIQAGRPIPIATSSGTMFPVRMIILGRGNCLVETAQKIEKAGRLKNLGDSAARCAMLLSVAV